MTPGNATEVDRVRLVLRHATVPESDTRMGYLVSEMTAYYHEERRTLSQGKRTARADASGGWLEENETKEEGAAAGLVPVPQIARSERLGGLLKHYYRKAA